MGAYYFRASGSNDKGGDHHAGHPLWEYNLNKTYTERIIRSQLSSKL